MGGGAATNVGRAGTGSPLRAVVDTNVLVRHLTGDPPEQARRATEFLADAEGLVLTDVIFAEIIYVLESFYELEREQVAERLRAVIGFPAIIVLDASVLLRALEVYEVHRIDFAEAYLVAFAEASGVGAVASFDRTIERVGTSSELSPAFDLGTSCHAAGTQPDPPRERAPRRISLPDAGVVLQVEDQDGEQRAGGGSRFHPAAARGRVGRTED